MKSRFILRVGPAARTALICLSFLAASSFAQLLPIAAQKPFNWTVTTAADDAKTQRITAKMAIAEGHYIYRDKTWIEPIKAKDVKFGDPVFSTPIKKKDKFTGKNESIYIDSLTVTIPVQMKKPGSEIRFVAHYQGCSESLCFLPASDTLTATTSPVTMENNAAPSSARAGTFSLLAAFLGGLLTCFTPCVYPLIPITLAIFGASTAKSRAHAFSLSFAYVLGLAVMFSVLGFVAAKTGSIFGQALANPFILGGIALVFIAFALSMFGLFDIQLPASIQEKLASTGGKGHRKSFIMGIVSGVIAAPCTGPALGAILAYVAVASTPWTGFSMLLLYALGMGLPFLILGTFSGLLGARPKPGPWMEGIKSVLGVALVVTALYLARPLFQDRLSALMELRFYPALMLTLAALGAAMGAIHLSFHSTAPGVRIRKLAGILFMVAGIFGTLHGRLWDAPAPSNLPVSETTRWATTIEQDLAEAKAQSKPVLIDYYAAWCAACNELDHKTFSDAAVKKELERFVVIRADMTRSNSAISDWARRQNVTGLPTLDFYDSNGGRVTAKRVMGFMDAKSFLAHIEGIR